jgi:transcriptional regulator with XRE-family HTH domain
LVADAEVLVRASQQNPPTDNRQTFKELANFAIVANIGARIRHLRVSSEMTQSQLRARSRVSKQYLSKVEGGLFIPSIATLERIVEALGVGLNRCFLSETTAQTVLEDPFIRELRPLLAQLDLAQKQWILTRLAAISNVPIQPGVTSIVGQGTGR